MRIARAVFRRLTAGSVFALLVGLFVLVVFWNRIVIVVPGGSGGAMWQLFFGGTRVNYGPIREGLHLIFPWDRIYIYDTRLQSRDQDYAVVSSDGLHLNVSMTLRWRAFPNQLGYLHRFLGPDYLETMLVPLVGSISREVMSQHQAEDIYSLKRNSIQAEILGRIRANKTEVGGTVVEDGKLVAVVDVLIREVTLPEQLRTAIQNKLEQAQIVQEYRYRVEREELESQRKAVEAKGIRTFQETVTPAISESYLKWRGIEATMELSKSPNSKVVIIGSGQGGLPVILDGFGRQEAAPAGTSGSPPSAAAGR